MNISLKKRVTYSYIVATCLVLIVGLSVFYHLDNLSKKVQLVTTRVMNLSDQVDQIRISTTMLMREQKKLMRNRNYGSQEIEGFEYILDSYHNQLIRLETFFQDVKAKALIAKMLGYVDSMITLSQSLSGSRAKDQPTFDAFMDLQDKTLDSLADFQDRLTLLNEKQTQQGYKMIEDTKKYMLMVLLVSFFAAFLMGLIIPGKIALPFKKLNDSIRELQECNFDISISYDQDDEIGELARELNVMIHNMKQFEELRADRISVEQRKFDILANLMQKNILVANAAGQLIYLNNKMYKFLDIESEEVLFKSMFDTIIPESIKEAFELALKRRTKIENSPIKIVERQMVSSNDIENSSDLSSLNQVDGDEETEEESSAETMHEVEVEVFSGYANIFPIRGKESARDYYMMVISQKMFS